MILSDMLLLRRDCLMQSRLTLSKAFSNSMKIICRSGRNFLHCSMMILTELMWSVHDEPALKPACFASTVEMKGSLIQGGIQKIFRDFIKKKNWFLLQTCLRLRNSPLRTEFNDLHDPEDYQMTFLGHPSLWR